MKPVLLAILFPLLQEADLLEQRISDLGDERAEIRESALQAILAAGPAAIPSLRRALASSDAEVRQRASCALGELERGEKLAGVLQPRPLVTAAFTDAPFEQALEEVAKQTGLRFEGAVPARPITLSFARAPLMKVLDALAEAAGDQQWSFESESVVHWRKLPPVVRPSAYTPGFRVSLSRIDVYKSWDYQQGHGLMWVYLETRLEPGIRPVSPPRFEVSDIRDEAGNELSRDTEIQECALKGPPREGSERSTGTVYESSPFTIHRLDRSVRKLSKIGGRAVFLFPLEREQAQMDNLCEESTLTRGPLTIQAGEILTNSMKLTVSTAGNPAHLPHHLDADSLVLVDAEGAEYVRGRDFDVRVDPLATDALRYCIEFNENICFQPCAVRFLITDQFLEKSVPFEFKDVPLP